VFFHAAVGVVFLTASSEPLAMPPVYRVELVAAPRPQPSQRRAPDVVQRPAEQPLPSTRPIRRTSQAETPPPPTKQPEVEREPAARTEAVELAPDVEPSTGTDPATVSTSGVDFPFPEYLRNLVAQVHRRWQRPSGNVSLRAEVMFFIHRDGVVTNFQFVQRSGNFTFDLEAQGAIEAAANAGAFGPLPEGYADDVLPVSFFFDPAKTR
jgi:outer membrane biosynthesis protein TonB